MRESKKYIGVKLLDAAPCTRGEYNQHKGWTIPADEDPTDEGYIVTYPDGYVSWSPKEQFESAYLELSPDPEKAALSVTQKDVNDFVTGIQVSKVSDKAVTVITKTRSGFDLYEPSACVDPANFDAEIGAMIGNNKNMEKLWAHMGFVLQWALKGLDPRPPETEAPSLVLTNANGVVLE